MAKTKLTGRKRDERITAYAFTAPAVILLIAFLVVPMIYTVYYSGFKYQIFQPVSCLNFRIRWYLLT